MMRTAKVSARLLGGAHSKSESKTMSARFSFENPAAMQLKRLHSVFSGSATLWQQTAFGGGMVQPFTNVLAIQHRWSSNNSSRDNNAEINDNPSPKAALDPSKLKEVPLVFCGQTFENPGQLSSWLMRWRVNEAQRGDPSSFYPTQEWEALEKLKMCRKEGNVEQLSEEWDNKARAGLMLKRAVLVTLEKLWLQKLGQKVVNTPQFAFLIRSIRIVEESLEILKITAPEHIIDDDELHPSVPEEMKDPMFTVPSDEQEAFANEKLAKDYTSTDHRLALDHFVAAGNLLLVLRNQGMQMLPAYRNVQLHALNHAKIIRKAAAHERFTTNTNTLATNNDNVHNQSPEDSEGLLPYQGGLPSRAGQQHLMNTIGAWLVLQNQLIVWLEQGHVNFLKPAGSNNGSEAMRKQWQQLKPAYKHICDSVLADIELGVLRYMKDEQISRRVVLDENFSKTMVDQRRSLKTLFSLLVEGDPVDGLEVKAPLDEEQKGYLSRHVKACDAFLLL